jgi:hypothetical protein
VLIIALLGASLALAYANGANDNFKAVATLYGSQSLDYYGDPRTAPLIRRIRRPALPAPQSKLRARARALLELDSLSPDQSI